MTQHVCSVQQVAQTPGVEIPNESLVIAAHEVFERHSAQLFVLVGFERSFHLLSASVAAQIPAVHNPISSQTAKQVHVNGGIYFSLMQMTTNQ